MAETAAAPTTTSDCRRCHGTGQIRAGLTCPACKGTGLAPVATEPEDDEDGIDNYTGDDLPIVVRADGIIDVIDNPCNITTEDAEFDRAMRSERGRELRGAGVDMERLAKIEGAYDAMLQQRGIHWGAGDDDSAAVQKLTAAIDATHAEIVKTRGY